jgi:predicted membrane chloride channel (bestrophin family)
VCLHRANLSGVKLAGANLHRANLAGANLHRANLSGAGLSEADLRRADLRGTDLHETNLSGADLRGANLSEANLSGADLSGVNLTGAKLRAVNLTGVNLTGANLKAVNLTGVNLTGANLAYALDLTADQVKAAKTDPSTQLPHYFLLCPWDPEDTAQHAGHSKSIAGGRLRWMVWKKHSPLFKAALVATVVVVVKWATHRAGWELISVNPLLSAIVAADVFLMGFLLSGVWSDYKESEKLPGELAASLEALADEAVSIHRYKNSFQGAEFLVTLSELSLAIREWFYKREHTEQLMERIAGFNQLFHRLDHEEVIKTNFVVRIKQEHANVRRLLIRIRVIRETQFVSAGYLIAQTTTVLLIIGLILAKIEPFYEAVFFVGVISFLVTFMILLIEDLDNPFGYYEPSSSQDVSLKPMLDVMARFHALAAGLRPDQANRGLPVQATSVGAMPNSETGVR